MTQLNTGIGNAPALLPVDLNPTEAMEWIHEITECLRQHGWAIEPPEVREFKALLSSIPGNMYSNVQGTSLRDHYHLFRDGAGKDLTCPPARLVARAVALAASDVQTRHVPIAWGGVPGFWQTVMRAELTGFVSVSMFGNATGLGEHSPFGVIVKS